MSRAFVLVFLASCGAPQSRASEPAAVSSGEDDVVCRNETPIGSHLQQTRCYRSEDEEQAREAARMALDRP